MNKKKWIYISFKINGLIINKFNYQNNINLSLPSAFDKLDRSTCTD